ncbi:MAG TPA: hypothetical protein VLA29_05650 [Acidimicrobiia bacterium]|nr:hypothetical protein [Acidimicrobiia bacterium]
MVLTVGDRDLALVDAHSEPNLAGMGHAGVLVFDRRRDRDGDPDCLLGTREDGHEAVPDEVDQSPFALIHPCFDEVTQVLDSLDGASEVVGHEPAVPDHVSVERCDLSSLVGQSNASAWELKNLARTSVAG